MINFRHFIPVLTYSNKYIPTINYRGNFIFNQSDSKTLVNNVKMNLIEDVSGFINVSEQIKKLDVGLNEKSINLHMQLGNNGLEEIINVIKSPYFYSISYKIISNGKTINSKLITNDNYNSKNFDHNFNYYLTKYNFTKDHKM